MTNEAMRKELRAFGAGCYAEGQRQARRGFKAYQGHTWLGYYGFMDERDKLKGKGKS